MFDIWFYAYIYIYDYSGVETIINRIQTCKIKLQSNCLWNEHKCKCQNMHYIYVHIYTLLKPSLILNINIHLIIFQT